MRLFSRRPDPHPPAPKTADEAWKIIEGFNRGEHVGMPMSRIEQAWTLALLDLRDRLRR
jgi:hypothetical protein